MSRTSPSNEGGSTSGHGNEVPQEYRADVERIFFEFLNMICSNRTYARCCRPSSPFSSGAATRQPHHPFRISFEYVRALNCMYFFSSLHSGGHRFQG